MKKYIFSICILLLSAFVSRAQSLKLVGTSPADGETISSLNSIEFEFDLSDVIQEYGDGEWGICPNGFYLEAFPTLNTPTTLYEGDESGTLIERITTAFRPNKENFKVGNKVTFEFKSFELKPNQEYTLVIEHEFYAGILGNSKWEVGTKLSFQNDPLILKFYGASEVAKVLECESNSLGENAKMETLCENVRLTFNHDITVMPEASVAVEENGINVANSIDISIDPSDSKSVLISFPETTLYNGHKYTIVVPEGIVGVADDTSSLNSEIDITLEGASFRSFGIGRVSPANNSTAIIDNIVVPFKFPVVEGSDYSYGFINIERAKYPMYIYKGTEEDGELVATINGVPDNTSLTFELTYPIEPGTLYTCVIDEGTVKAYAIGDPRQSYLKDYISEKVVLTYTTPELSDLGRITLKGSDFTLEETDYIETVTFSDIDYIYGNTAYSIISTNVSGSSQAGILYEVTADGDKEIKRFKVATSGGTVVKAEVNADLYSGKVYRLVIPDGTFKVLNSNFLSRYVTSEEYSITILGTKSTESESEFTSNIAEGQKVSHIGVVSFYTNSEVKAVEDANLEIRKGDEIAASAPLRVVREEGYTHIFADFSSEEHIPYATENGVAYVAVLPQGAVVDAANENLLNKEYSVAFNGLDAATEFVSIDLNIADVASATYRMVSNEESTIKIEPAEGWILDKLTLNGTDDTVNVADSFYTVPALDEDANVEVSFVYGTDIPFLDLTVGVEGVAVDGTDYVVFNEMGNVVIDNLKGGEHIVVYNMAGKILGEHDMQGTNNRLQIPLSEGYYIILVDKTAFKIKH